MSGHTQEDRADLAVFRITRSSRCGQCEEELPSGSFIIIESKEAVCLPCADLSHLEFLPRGDAALTRRARKYSRVSPVVLRWSRARKRYERQGVMAEPEAVLRAEEECLDDHDLRAARRARARARREELDDAYVGAFAARVRELYPRCPADEAAQIAEHACVVGSGRVGRTQAAKDLEPSAVELAVRASIRHRHTPYDELLCSGLPRGDARAEVADLVSAIEAEWRGPTTGRSP